MRTVISVILLSLLANTAFATTYYVAPAGTPGIVTWPNCTSESTPCEASQNVQAFLDAQAGDTLQFADGLYAGLLAAADYRVTWQAVNSGNSSAPIIFKAKNKYAAILEGWMPLTQGETGWSPIIDIIGSRDKAYITWDGFTLRAKDPNGSIMAGVRFHGSAHYGVVQNCDIIGATHNTGGAINYDGVRIEGPDNITVFNNKIHGFKEASNNWNTSAIKFYGTGSASDGSITRVYNNEIYDNTTGIYIKSHYNYDVELYNNFIHDNYIEGFRIPRTKANYRHKIYNNIVICNSRYSESKGVNAGESSGNYINDLQIYNNTFANCRSRELILGVVQAGYEPIVYNNIFYSPYTAHHYSYSSPVKFKQSDHNLFYNEADFYVLSINYSSLSAWQNSGMLAAEYNAGCGSNLNPGCNSLNTNPLFTNNSGTLTLISDFILQPSSPAVGAGRDGENMGANPSTVGLDVDILPPTLLFSDSR